ncbi:MAG TPA: GGDEF domain-containing protein [Longimicrobiales bacterium]|nr:GGDEF domain-containing protein [Longimicrobiales bacterium]
MTPRWHFGRPEIPAYSIALCAAALAVPVSAQVLFVESAGEHELLLWLLAVVPAFLLAYYRGWRGAATALAAGMAVLSLTQAFLVTIGHAIEDRLLLLGIVAFFILLSLTGGWLMDLLHNARSSAERLALTDDLTGLSNRRHAHMRLERMFTEAQDGRLSVLFFDLDRFKEYNDRYGHPGGDRVLAGFADMLQRLTPPRGFSCRYGGEEFLTIIDGDGLETAVQFARSVRNGLARQEDLREALTVSVGIATYDPSMKSRGELLAAADAALYAAKAAGRNTIRVHQVDGAPTEPLSVAGI